MNKDGDLILNWVFCVVKENIGEGKKKRGSKEFKVQAKRPDKALDLQPGIAFFSLYVVPPFALTEFVNNKK